MMLDDRNEVQNNIWNFKFDGLNFYLIEKNKLMSLDILKVKKSKKIKKLKN